MVLWRFVLRKVRVFHLLKNKAAKHKQTSSLGEGTMVIHSTSLSVLKVQNGMEGKWNWCTWHFSHLPTVPNHIAAPPPPHIHRHSLVGDIHLLRYSLFSDRWFCINLLGWLVCMLTLIITLRKPSLISPGINSLFALLRGPIPSPGKS